MIKRSNHEKILLIDTNTTLFNEARPVYPLALDHLQGVLKQKGILYHYVGSPGSKYKKRDIPKGVMTRLREAGFQNVTRREDTLGVTARK